MPVWTLPESYEGTYVLEFDSPTFDGLEVRMGRHTFGAVEAAAALRNIDTEKAKRGELDLADWGALQAALAEFAEALHGWNLVDREGKPVGTDLAAVRKLDLVFVIQIFLVWVRALVGVEWADFKENEIPVEVAQ